MLGDSLEMSIIRENQFNNQEKTPPANPRKKLGGLGRRTKPPRFRTDPLESMNTDL